MTATLGYVAAGVLTGLAVAMPVGAIGLLVLRTGQAGGIRPGVASALGVATTDLVYAVLAVLAGGKVAAVLGSFITPVRVLAGIVLIALGVREWIAQRRHRRESTRPPDSADPAGVPTTPTRAFLTLAGLTAANPLTIGYFASAAVALGGTMSGFSAVMFIAGVFMASALWQVLLAGLGVLSRRILTPRLVQASATVSAALLVGMGVYAVGTSVYA